MVKLQKTFDILLKLLFYVITSAVIYMLVLKLTNHSPLLETVIAGAVIAIVVKLFDIHHTLGRNEEQLKMHMEITKHTFTRVWNEFSEIKKEVKKIDHIEHKIDSLDHRLERIEKKLGA